MAAAACSSLCGSLATEVTSRFIRSSMLSRFKSPAIGTSSGAPANARPPIAPSNTPVSRRAALRRALPPASSAFMRNERRLRGTDISCLPHERGLWSLAHFHGQGKYDLCSTPTADYVTCSVDRGGESVTGVSRTALLRSGTSELLREQRAPGRNTTTSPRTGKAPAIRRARLTGRRVG